MLKLANYKTWEKFKNPREQIYIILSKRLNPYSFFELKKISAKHEQKKSYETQTKFRKRNKNHSGQNLLFLAKGLKPVSFYKC